MSYNASTQVTHDALVVKPEHRYGSKGQAIPQDSEENRGSIGAQSSTSVVDQVRTPPEDAGVTSSSTICPAPVCRQFWKAGSYIDELSSKSQQPTGKNYLHVHPMFLHSNATSHKWAFGAVAELLDNAVDEIQNGATFVIVDKTTNPKDGTTALLVQDDGGGMDPQAMRHCMGFGFSDKKSDSAIGRYGNGFKTSTMRLGADVIVFSRHFKDQTWTQSIGLLSYTYLTRTGHDRIVVPILDYEYKASTSKFVTLQDREHFISNLSILLEWSPFSTEAELLQQFDNVGSHGTKVIIYNLWLNSDAKLELDFDSDAEDILIEGNIKKTGCKIMNDHIATRFSYSLRVYLSILYLRIPETFKILLRGKVVEHHNVADDLKHQQYILYKPQAAGHEEAEVVTTIGFLKEAPKVNLCGFCVYHKNRLIMPFWQVVSYSDSRGRGVVGALEANFVEPTHNKQDFEKTVLLQKLEKRLKEMTVEYWNCHSVLIGYRDLKKRRPKVPQNLQPGGRTNVNMFQNNSAGDSGKQTINRPPGFPGVFHNANLASLPRVSSEPVVLEKRKEHPDLVANAASKRKVGSDGFSVPGHIRVEQFVQGSATRSQDSETTKLMDENKKLRAKCLDHRVRSQNLELKAMNLSSELEKVKTEYERLMEELQALGTVKEERSRNVNT
ncbi:PREDICTED: MORC family CW-type zinc finger protein 3-like isoform X1 [Brassica oleracea var. oleracea]|uniref:Morc S5 domain-containing protein n=1 Tax=Brassica oleracea var. oleracea TaxID=109376 RepID=A0A0D3DWJ2_BRAOL|nr:PREDICTED: MORC family CW-type zinc finger protein 3-like isoform X1 [Brassica oleracea var. oleracea]XP_013605131.1 PREDICTED: MORC family CW-type zinc finger protein 3-like isoform X1 [Brassica oleracea var. oleracea]